MALHISVLLCSSLQVSEDTPCLVWVVQLAYPALAMDSSCFVSQHAHFSLRCRL